MTELRLIILAIGAILLGLIYYFGTRKKEVSNDDAFEPVEPNFSSDSAKVAPNELPRKDSGLSIDEAHQAHLEEASPTDTSKEKIVTLFLHAKNGQQFDWHLIQKAAEQVGLEFGSDNLYYRFNGSGKSKELIFMVANMLKPGIFQPDMRTTGLVMIMTLPGVMPALDMWDSMFPVGERIADILGGKLTDENHHLFTRQRIASMREEMRQFDHDAH